MLSVSAGGGNPCCLPAKIGDRGLFRDLSPGAGLRIPLAPFRRAGRLGYPNAGLISKKV